LRLIHLLQQLLQLQLHVDQHQFLLLLLFFQVFLQVILEQLHYLLSVGEQQVQQQVEECKDGLSNNSGDQILQ
jgi:hypothetical protein